MQRRGVRITALGRYVPERVLTNYELEKLVDTKHDWIVQRTGIETRHIAATGTPTSELATRAALGALQARALDPQELDLIIVATVTPDMALPATACIVQRKLGARRAWGFDISAACCGFLYALTVGAQFVETGRCERVLVIGADVMSSIVNFRDRSTSILFGDGAGAVLLEASSDARGLLDCRHEADGEGGGLLCVPAGGSALPATAETVQRELHFVRQEGAAVYKFAVRKLCEISAAVLARNGLMPQDIGLFVPHQGNLRIIEAASARLGLPPAKVVCNIQHYGNTAAASIPLALCSALDEQRLRDGDLVLLASVGSGLSAACVLLKWSDVPGWSRAADARSAA